MNILLRQAGKAFIDKYCDGQYTEEKALNNSINAAVSRNRTYTKDIPNKRKEAIRSAWKAKLVVIINKHKKNRISQANWLRSILDLQEFMNTKFKKDLSHSQVANRGLRISHAQKSLSLFMKYKWITSKNYPEPPACPIDRRILSHVKAPIAQRSWTKTNSIDEYKQQLQFIRSKIRYNSIAKWELKTFNGL